MPEWSSMELGACWAYQWLCWKGFQEPSKRAPPRSILNIIEPFGK